MVYLDALVVRSRASGAVQNKTVYLALGVNMDGEKELLGQGESVNILLKCTQFVEASIEYLSRYSLLIPAIHRCAG